MAFRTTNLARLAKFNSANSSDFIDFYEKLLDDKIAAKNAEPKHKTFAPSSFRCPRISWFRLRGVQPDAVAKPDRTMEFSAQIGTACHETIQKNLKEALGSDWIEVEDYLRDNPDIGVKYCWELEKAGLETRISIPNPPIRFACDGIIRWKGKIYLLEIKTSEFSSFDELIDPKSQHVDQIKCYATLLGIEHVLVLYQDRQYGGLKCYEMSISTVDNKMVLDRIQYVMDMVEANLAPDRLPREDSWCTASMCPYYKKCKEWG